MRTFDERGTYPPSDCGTGGPGLAPRRVMHVTLTPALELPFRDAGAAPVTRCPVTGV